MHSHNLPEFLRAIMVSRYNFPFRLSLIKILLKTSLIINIVEILWKFIHIKTSFSFFVGCGKQSAIDIRHCLKLVLWSVWRPASNKARRTCVPSFFCLFVVNHYAKVTITINGNLVKLTCHFGIVYTHGKNLNCEKG